MAGVDEIPCFCLRGSNSGMGGTWYLFFGVFFAGESGGLSEFGWLSEFGCDVGFFISSLVFGRFIPCSEEGFSCFSCSFCDVRWAVFVGV